jgi:hypothetical protein
MPTKPPEGKSPPNPPEGGLMKSIIMEETSNNKKHSLKFKTGSEVPPSEGFRGAHPNPPEGRAYEESNYGRNVK